VGHLWSLSVEEQFYLIWPLIMCFAKLRTCVALAVFATFWGILIRAFFVVTGIQLIDPAMRYAFPFVCGPIATGCLLAVAAPWVRRLLNEHRRLSGPAAVTLAVALVLLLDTLDLGSANRFTGILKSLLLTFCVARFVFRPEGFAAVVLNSRPAVFIGKLSYSLYLWQQLFFNPFSNSLLCKFPLNLCLTFAVACLSYFLIEIKFLNLRSRFRRESIQKPAMPQAALSA
jgi:peptidoglycan/LPS O-acetylase OafA/YrhL